MNKPNIRRWLPLIVLITLLILFFGFHLDHYVNFSTLRDNRRLLIAWTEIHFLTASLIYIVFYTLAVAISIPGAVFLTLAGGFLFGIFPGLLFVIFSATLGATLLFLAVRSAFGESLAKSASGWTEKMRKGFQNHAFSYLLTLRLIPLFPFWVVNIVPALLNVNLKTFVTATLLGIIPGSAVYVILGSELSQILAKNQTPNLAIIFEPFLLIPLIALGLLSLMPVLYQSHSRKKSMLAAATIHCDLAIIGGGAAGLSLAAGASQLGLKVLLLESDKMGGDCLNYGCIPSKSLLYVAKMFYKQQHLKGLGIHADNLSVNFLEVMQYVRNVIANIAQNDSVARFESFGVQVIQQVGKFTGKNTLETADASIYARHIVIASGSRAFIPPIKGLDKVPYLTNETIFNLEEQPAHLVVIGGGPIGCELAQAFAMLGSRVTLLEGLHILPKEDEDCAAILRHEFEAMNMLIYDRIQIQAITMDSDAAINVKFIHQEKLLTISASHLLIATGRRANVDGLDLEKAAVKYSDKGIEVNARLQTDNNKIFAIGDVTGPYQFTHMASYQAGIVLRNIVFKIPARVNYHSIPWVTYTEPELAHVGISTLDALKREGTIITEWPFSDNDRAQTEQALRGKIKIITDKRARILGVTIVGSQAGELILPWVMAIREKRTLRSFTDVIVPYPTLSEISKRVASEFYRPKLFSDKTRRLVRWLNKC